MQYQYESLLFSFLALLNAISQNISQCYFFHEEKQEDVHDENFYRNCSTGKYQRLQVPGQKKHKRRSGDWMILVPKIGNCN